MTHPHLSPKVSADQAIKNLKAIVGESAVLTAESDLKSWGTDWTKVFEPKPLCVVFPTSTKKVSELLTYCHTNELAVTPSGGRTGLCAGAVASDGEVVINLSRMNKILEVDQVGLTITAEAGVTTDNQPSSFG
jgi:FAD/FMN-containing dehydrogenase